VKTGWYTVLYVGQLKEGGIDLSPSHKLQPRALKMIRREALLPASTLLFCLENVTYYNIHCYSID
jgi:hypothetical protein